MTASRRTRPELAVGREPPWSALGACLVVVAVATILGCGGGCPTSASATSSVDEWESKLEARKPLALDPSASVTIKRDVHNLDIDVEAKRFADAFHDVMRDPKRRFGLIKIDRQRRNAGQPFHLGERFQGRYELDDAIKKDLPAWLAKLFGNAVKGDEAQALMCHIENEATSDYGEIITLDLAPAPEMPYVIAYRYLDGTPIAGSSTFTVAPTGPSSCRLTQTFEYQEQSLATATFFSAGGLKLHDQVVLSQASQAASAAGGHIVSTDIPPEYAAKKD